MEKEIEAWDQHLSKFTVKDLIPSGFKLLFAKQSDKVFDVLNLLSTHRTLSVPIFDTEKNQFVGLVDVLDLLYLFVTMSDMKRIVDLMNGKEVDWASFISQENKILANQTIRDVANASTRNPWTPMSADTPISVLLEKFTSDVKLHRVPIVNETGEVIGLVTQSRVIEFLSHEVPKFPKIAERHLREWLPSTERPPISVPPTTLALDAYRIMLDKGISAVAVVDEKDGKLVGCLSASDIKGSLDVNLFADLYLPIPLYLDKATAEFQRKSLTPITCQANDTMLDCLHKISTGKVHRLFMINAEGKATVVLSLGDFIAALHSAVKDHKNEKNCI